MTDQSGRTRFVLASTMRVLCLVCLDMTILFSGPFHAMFSNGVVAPEDSFDIDRASSFAGQSNGLVGTARPNVILLTMGLNTGLVRLTVELADSAPPADDGWDEVVEGPWKLAFGGRLCLLECCGDAVAEFDMPAGEYRVRYCARRFAQAEQMEDSVDDAGEPIEDYALWIWPASPSADVIIKATSPVARHWHLVAQGTAR